jgi:hypothetical protein
MVEGIEIYEEERIWSLILTIREQKVILDTDLALIYGVTTKRLNEQVKRNPERFPEEFLFQLSREETDKVKSSRSQTVTLKHKGDRSQFATGSQKHRNPRHLPYEEIRMTMAGWFHEDQEPPVMTPPRPKEWVRQR